VFRAFRPGGSVTSPKRERFGLKTVSRFCLPLVRQGCATCPPRRGLAATAGGAGLLVGSARFRHRLGVLVSGHSGTSHYGRREGGEVECDVGVPVDDQAAGVAFVGPDVGWQSGFHRAAAGTGLGGGEPAVGGRDAASAALGFAGESVGGGSPRIRRRRYGGPGASTSPTPGAASTTATTPAPSTESDRPTPNGTSRHCDGAVGRTRSGSVVAEIA
jgi:hypothetical protein